MIVCLSAPSMSELTDPKRKGPLRLYRAYYILHPDQLAKIPEISYTSLTLARMIWPQLTYRPMEVFTL